MLELFYMGGPLFMGILTLILIAVLVVTFVQARAAFSSDADAEKTRTGIGYVKSVGLFALVIGALGQFIGLYDAFRAIEQIGAISPGMLAGGLKVSSITTLYGLTIYAISYLIWLGLSLKLSR